MERVLVFAAALCLVASRSTLPYEAAPSNRQDSEECNTEACQEAAKLLLDSMDTSADPCQDFYRYSCGGWIEKNQIPEDKSRYSTFDILIDGVKGKVAGILKNATNENHPKAALDSANFFQACMDEDARETQGVEPLNSLLNSLGGWPMANPEWTDAGYQWQTVVATIARRLGIRTLISVSVTADANRTSQNIIYLRQPRFGIGRNQLVNLDGSTRNREIVAAYKKFIIDTGKLLNPNTDEAQLRTDTDRMIQFESDLAKLSRPPSETREASAWYHKMSVAEVQTTTENTYFEWKDFLNTVFLEYPEVTGETEVILSAKDYIKKAIKLAHDTDPRILANYVGWIVLKNIGHHTTKTFRENKFQFDQIEMGIEKEGQLEQGCADETVSLLGYAAGRLYVDKFLNEEEKQDAEEIKESLRSAYKTTLRENTWMDQDTKNKAIAKLDAMISKMGYPQWIKDDNKLNEYYSSVPDIKQNEFFASFVDVTKATTAISLAEWNQPTDRVNDWVTEPPVVDAFYEPNSNSLTIPAGILNLPFYKYGGSLALNFGGIGAVIGHEMSHGFDDQGSQFDTEGNLVDWWSEQIKDEFKRKADCFRNQYSSYVDSTTNMTLNGNNTVGENIADNGAIRNAFIAYKMQHSGNNDVTQNKRLPGVSATPEQLFFLGFSTIWCGKERKESLEWTIQYDPHAPGEFRATVPMTNSKAFAEAFNCALGSRMNPEDKCVLW